MSREMWGDTHKTMQAEDFGTAYQNDPVNRPRFGSATIAAVRKRNSGGSAGSARKGSGSLSGTWRDGPAEFRSVFKPTPEQEHVCK